MLFLFRKPQRPCAFLLLCAFFVTFLLGGVQSIGMSVCFSLCSHISKMTCPNLKFSVHVHGAVARSSSVDNAVHYVRLVLWIMSCFQIMAQTQIQVIGEYLPYLLGGAGGKVFSQQFPCSLVFCVLKPITKCWLGRAITAVLCFMCVHRTLLSQLNESL